MMLLKGGNVCVQDELRRADVLIQDGVIAEMATDIAAEGARVIDCTGKVIAPGFIDAHTHLREPGQEYKETVASGAKAAAHGGYTAVCCMANTEPVNDNAAVTRRILDLARDAACRVYPIGAITKGLQGAELAEMGELQAAGCVAVSDDGKPVTNAAVLRLALQYAQAFNLRVIEHAEDMKLSEGGLMHLGDMSTLLGLMGIPASAEDVGVARALCVAGEAGLPIHIAHVSTAGAVALIREAKARGVRVTCETAPHYIAGIDALCDGYNTNAKVNPPLRDESHREAVIAGLLDGTIDIIATDHAPHHADEKRCEFSLAKSGISGLETAFALCHAELVIARGIPLPRLISWMSTVPAQVMGLPGGKLEKGAPADLCVLDTQARWTIHAAEFYSQGKNTPFDGREVTGKAVMTLCGGAITWEEGA